MNMRNRLSGICKRAVLAAAKTLRHTDDWNNTYNSPDLTPKEREEGRKLREELKTRRNNGKSNLIIRRNRIIQTSNKETGPQNSTEQNGHQNILCLTAK